MPATAKEKAVLSLLKPPAVHYVQKLKESLDRDPHYLESHREDVGNIIIGFLADPVSIGTATSSIASGLIYSGNRWPVSIRKKGEGEKMVSWLIS